MYFHHFWKVTFPNKQIDVAFLSSLNFKDVMIYMISDNAM